MNTHGPLLTSEAARLLEVSAETIRLWERSGRLPAIKTALGIRLFDYDAVLELARERQRERAARESVAADEQVPV